MLLPFLRCAGATGNSLQMGMGIGNVSGSGASEHQPSVSTSSSRLLCSFCCSMRFCLSANSCLLYSSCSRSCCSCSSCCLRRASDRSLFSCCSLRKSRRRVDSPGTLTMELQQEEVKGSCTIKPDGPLNTFFKGRGTLIKYSMMLNFNLVSFGAKTQDAYQIHALSGRCEMRPSKIRTNSVTVEPLTNHICHKSPSIQSSLDLSHVRGSFETFSITE